MSRRAARAAPVPHARIAATLLVFALVGPPVGATVTFLGLEVLATGRVHSGSAILFGVFMTASLLPALVWTLGLVPALVAGAATVATAVRFGRRAALAAAPVAGALVSMPVVPLVAGPDGLASGPLSVLAATGAVAALASALLALPVLPRRAATPSPPARDPC